jgi:hypothetical protein
MRCNESGVSIAAAIFAFRGPGAWVFLRRPASVPLRQSLTLCSTHRARVLSREYMPLERSEKLIKIYPSWGGARGSED